MANPLDYFNPNDPRRSSDEKPRAKAQAIVPQEFDTLLTETEDRAAVTAIIKALDREHIPSHCPKPGMHSGVEARLYVRQSDHDRAALIAAETFVRRKRVREMQKPLRPDPGSTHLPSVFDDIDLDGE